MKQISLFLLIQSNRWWVFNKNERTSNNERKFSRMEKKGSALKNGKLDPQTAKLD